MMLVEYLQSMNEVEIMSKSKISVVTLVILSLLMVGCRSGYNKVDESVRYYELNKSDNGVL